MIYIDIPKQIATWERPQVIIDERHTHQDKYTPVSINMDSVISASGMINLSSNGTLGSYKWKVIQE